MLDVHPPEHTPHTWRDFFIHIATIVVGLIIAVGLEQGVEAIHHHHQRHQLREDLRDEAEQRSARLQTNVKINAADVAWYHAVLDAGRQATPSGDFVTFVLPSRKRAGYISEIAGGVWTAAKASGAVAVLPREEIELWDSVESKTITTERSFNAREDSLKLVFGIIYRLNLSSKPGETVRLKPDDRDELMRAFAKLLEDTWQLERDDAYWQGSCEGMLHGAKTTDELTKYESAAVEAMPK